MIGHADRTEVAQISTLLPVATEGNAVRRLRYRYMEDLSTKTPTITVDARALTLLVAFATSAGHGHTPAAKEGLKEYAGEWIALDDGNVIARDSSAIAVLRSAREHGVRKPHILFVEDIQEGVSRLGL